MRRELNGRRSTLGASTAALAALLCGALAVPSAHAADETVTVSGTVTSAAGGPVEDADVTVYFSVAGAWSDEDKEAAYAQTDEDGEYSAVVPAGREAYTVGVEKSGFVETYHGEQYELGIDDTFTLPAGADRPSTDVVLAIPSTITGEVFRPAGPSHHVELQTYRQRADGSWAFGGSDGTATGTYAVPRLAPGVHVVKAWAYQYASRYAGGSYDVATATQVTLSATGSVVDIADVELTVGTSVSGTVKDAWGNPVISPLDPWDPPYLDVFRWDAALGFWELEQSGPADVQGRYTIDHLRPGKHKIRAKVENGRDHDLGTTEFTVGDVPVTGVDIVTGKDTNPEYTRTTLTAPTTSVAYGGTVAVKVEGARSAPTGTVTLTSGATVVGRATVTNGTANVPVSPAAKLGANTVTAEFTGTNYATSASAPAAVTVTKAKAKLAVKKKVRRAIVRVQTEGFVTTGRVVITHRGDKVDSAKLSKGKAVLTGLPRRVKVKAVFKGSPTATKATRVFRTR